LADDDRRRAASLELIQAEEEAREVLRRKLRDRISEALVQRRLLPVWLTAELGYGPKGDAAAWLDIGADVLMYRIVYGVRDPVVALGDAEGSDHLSQKAWREKLTARVRAWR
jgi:hypothetical protein